jgi:hypothetical protein
MKRSVQSVVLAVMVVMLGGLSGCTEEAKAGPSAPTGKGPDAPGSGNAGLPPPPGGGGGSATCNPAGVWSYEATVSSNGDFCGESGSDSYQVAIRVVGDSLELTAEGDAEPWTIPFDLATCSSSDSWDESYDDEDDAGNPIQVTERGSAAIRIAGDTLEAYVESNISTSPVQPGTPCRYRVDERARRL